MLVVVLLEEDSFFAGLASEVLELESFFGVLESELDFFFASARESVR